MNNTPYSSLTPPFSLSFPQFTFASNTATIIGGTLVGSKVQLRIVGAFVYSFVMAGIIHPLLARFFWAAGQGSRCLAPHIATAMGLTFTTGTIVSSL